MHRPIAIALAVALLGACASAQTTRLAPTAVKNDAHAFSSAIDAGDFAAHVRTLASDAFGGRGPGSAGERLTTDYLIAQFKRMGLEPGNHGQWLQAVPVVSTTLEDTDATLQAKAGGHSESFAYGDDFMAVTLQQKPEVRLDGADVVFLGYGADAPEYRWNDYAGIDVKGKVVVVLVNDPGWGDHDASLFQGRAMTYYGRWTYKYEEAARKGAAACFVVHETAGAGYPWAVVRSSWSGAQFALPLEAGSAPTLPVAGWLTTDAARRLFAAAGKDFDALKAAADHRGFKPVDLDARVSLDLRSRIGHMQSHNVLALLKGSERPGEAVVYSAHWDHLGTNPALADDKIYNGAVDNGTGVAALLEIAGAFAAQRPRPARSVLFAAVTLEESGLLGSQYYVAHPVFAADDTVADINMDALPVFGPAHDMIVIGYGNSQLDGYLDKAVAVQGRHLTPDPTPEQGSYFRSDHLNFAKAGIPSLYAKGGDDLVEGGETAGRRAEADYNQHRYHKPADEYDPGWDLRGVVEDVQALYDVGRRLAAGDDWPCWSADSPFRAKRAARCK
jgi:Zn-dependent M28 family amino/carboxypeptidase